MLAATTAWNLSDRPIFTASHGHIECIGTGQPYRPRRAIINLVWNTCACFGIAKYIRYAARTPIGPESLQADLVSPIGESRVQSHIFDADPLDKGLPWL